MSIDLSYESDIKKPSSYGKINTTNLSWMKIVQAKDEICSTKRATKEAVSVAQDTKVTLNDDDNDEKGSDEEEEGIRDMEMMLISCHLHFQLHEVRLNGLLCKTK